MFLLKLFSVSVTLSHITVSLGSVLYVPPHISLPSLQGQGLVPEEEWDQFMSILRQPLPSTFRITGTHHVATAVRECLQHTFFVELSKALQSSSGEGEGEGEELAPPTPLPWCVAS